MQKKRQEHDDIEVTEGSIIIGLEFRWNVIIHM